MSLKVFVDICQRTTKKSSRPTAKNSSPFSPHVILAFERLRLVLRRKRADPLLLLWWYCCTFHLSFHSSLQLYEFLLCRLSLSLSFSCSGFGTLHSLVHSIHASKDLLRVRHPSTPSALLAPTTARRSHDRPHNTNSRAMDRVICLFSGTRTECKQQVSIRVSTVQ